MNSPQGEILKLALIWLFIFTETIVIARQIPAIFQEKFSCFKFGTYISNFLRWYKTFDSTHKIVKMEFCLIFNSLSATNDIYNCHHYSLLLLKFEKKKCTDQLSRSIITNWQMPVTSKLLKIQKIYRMQL